MEFAQSPQAALKGRHSNLPLCGLWSLSLRSLNFTEEMASKIFWLMVSTPLKNMKVSWDYYYSILFPIYGKSVKNSMVPVTTKQSSYLWRHNVPDHRPSRKTCPGDHGSSEPNRSRFGRAKGRTDTTRQACHGWISSQAQVVSLACQDFACCLGET